MEATPTTQKANDYKGERRAQAIGAPKCVELPIVLMTEAVINYNPDIINLVPRVLQHNGDEKIDLQ